MYSLRFGWKLRRIGRTVFLMNREKTLEISELSYDLLRYLARPRSLEDVTSFIFNFIEKPDRKALKRDMKELLNFFKHLGAIRTN